ncbi:glycoside hydrolase superfamily [Gymnopilus junonius]|uniref:glucan 1,3-beta-glucosidase n=1 Tax=Gymnopilus junonius TaxID=109634 RepID=A0A9P5ND37_GYMJU|nr:glycoside hydrolase superfamily [Gymnopilus junonius]
MSASPPHSVSSQLPESKNASDAQLNVSEVESDSDLAPVVDKFPQKKPKLLARPRVIALIALVVLIIVFLGIFLPVFFVVVRKPTNKSTLSTTGVSGGGESTSASAKPPQATPSSVPITGGNGSLVKLENGTEFTYKNQFGGFWVQDPANPFNNNAQPNSWTPPLNTSWRWGVDRIYGVNLGGWLVMEPFITPSLYQKYPTAVDEFTLSQALAADTASGGLQQLEDHYATFITELDIAQIAGAGLNFVRVPLAFWAIETWPGEPYLAKTSWKYFVKLLNWARKYGVRVCLDLHAVPGSQNGFNHSGKSGAINFLQGNMGLANAERTLYYIRILTEFISQPEYRDVVPLFGIINEATVSQEALTSFYLQAHTMIRNITGLGEGHGPYIVIHDAFNLGGWSTFLRGSDRVILDTHPYFSFSTISTAPIAVEGAGGIQGGEWPTDVCTGWGPGLNNSRSTFGVTIAGEFAGTPNNCGLFLLGVNTPSTDPQCPEYDAWETYNSTMKQGIQEFIMSSMDALGDWFFWTWKIGPSQAGRVESPLWSYQLGLENGWIPADPRTASGLCGQIGAALQPFDGTYLPWQTGTPSSIPASSTAQYPWPPPTISGADVPVSLLPTYTGTAPVITLPPATFTVAAASVTKPADGWFNTQDTVGGVTAVAGCSYPNEYDGVFAVIPTAPCTGSGAAATAA